MTNTHKADALGWGRISGFGIEQTPPYALVGLQRIEKELIELRARVEALEAQQQPQDKLDRLIAQDRAASDAPRPGGLVERVIQAMINSPHTLGDWKPEARAVIREVAAALLEWHDSDQLVHTAWEAAKWLEQEAQQ